MPVYLPGLTAGGLGYGGASYGFSVYGGGALPPLVVFVDDGYGGGAYGTSPYGSLDVIPPRVSSATSLDGFRVEVFFSEEMSAVGLTTAGNYTFSATFGAPITTTAVTPGTAGVQGGYTSVIVTHSGTTLGGLYGLVAANLTDVSENPITSGSVSFRAKGDSTTATVAVVDGRTVRAAFKKSTGAAQTLLAEAVVSPGVEDDSTYEVTTSYAVEPTAADFTLLSDLSTVEFDLHPMTSATYTLKVGPALAYDYSGSVLPDEDPNLTAVEIGTGSSEATGAGLLLSHSAGVTYGWRFLDDSGRLTDTSTFRTDVTFDASSAVIYPAVLNSSFATVSFSDGTVQIDVVLGDTAGVKTLSVASGTLSLSASAEWAADEMTLTLLRNQKGGFYSLLVDGTPVLTWDGADADGVASFAAGASLVLAAAHSVSLFRLEEIRTTASETLFTSSWNFIHELDLSFVGSAAMARATLRTQRGPLVRGWGDATPAEKTDVTVRVNDVEVEVSEVNPYTGVITLATPIPYSAPGTVTVEVDYIWFQSPLFYLAGLNTDGLVLNAYPRALNGGARLGTSGTHGYASSQRFVYGVLLGPPQARPTPKRVGHHYTGFQDEYSALLNSPATLLLNRSPDNYALGSVKAETLASAGRYTATEGVVPGAADPAWVLLGEDSGSLGDGYYTVVDATAGSYGSGQAAAYYQTWDAALPALVSESFRVRVAEYTADGVFTGVAAGVETGDQLVLVGMLDVSGFQHIGILVDARYPHLEESWTLGFGVEATFPASDEIQIPFASLPGGVGPGTRIRIAAGPQAGVYTVATCGVVYDEDTATLTIEEELPSPVDGFDSDSATVYFEIDWASYVSVSIQGRFEDSFTIQVRGDIAGEAFTAVNPAAFPAQTSLVLPVATQGYTFWGSVSRRATSTSDWDFVFYARQPDQLLKTVQGVSAYLEMNELPQENTDEPWYLTGIFGESLVDSTGDALVLKKNSGSADIPVSFSYQRIEPFLSRAYTLDLEAKVRLESGAMPYGDISIQINNGRNLILFASLLYTQSATLRRLVSDLPTASLTGLQTPAAEGWTASTTLADPTVYGDVLVFEKAAATSGYWYTTLVAPTTVDYTGTVFEATLRVDSITDGSLGGGCLFGARVMVSSTTAREIGVTLTSTGNLLLLDSASAVKATIATGVDVTEFHTYRFSVDPDAATVVVLVDDVVVSTTALTLFSAATSSARLFVGAVGSGTCTWTLDALSWVPLRPVAKAGSVLGRTFGLLKRRGDSSSIDGWVIPRSDATSAENSSVSAIPVQMDWTSYCHIRLLADPEWGVSFFRPDQPPPPGFTGDYVTGVTDPTAAWATLEWPDVPASTDRQEVTWGALLSESISQSRWDFLRYRIRGEYSGFGIAPQHMVLNQYATLASPEWNYDTTPEVREITSRSSTLINVFDSAIKADRVFLVQVGGTVLDSSAWGFDPETQNLILSSPLPSAQYPVVVTFAPARPVSLTYLCDQPLSGTVTVLNAGTPPVPKSQGSSYAYTAVSASALNDPEGVLNDIDYMSLNDPYAFLEVESTGLYSALEFCEVEEGDDIHISPYCDAEGLVGIELSGSAYYDGPTVVGGPGGTFGGQGWGQPSFDQTRTFALGGGRALNGTEAILGSSQPVQGSAGAVLYPNGRGPGWQPLASRFGFNQELAWEIASVYEDDWDIAGGWSDNVPPTYADATDPNPNGTPGTTGNGALVYLIQDYADSPFSRLGPWGQGTEDLSVYSLVGGGEPTTDATFVVQGGSPLPLVLTETSGTIQAAN